MVLEVSPKIRELLVTKGRLYVGWAACRVDDYLGVTLQMPRIGAYRKVKEDFCGHCSQSGHRRKDCLRRGTPLSAGCVKTWARNLIIELIVLSAVGGRNLWN